MENEYSIWTDRYGKPELLGSWFKSADTARSAVRKFASADISYHMAHGTDGRYWVQCDDIVVGKVYTSPQ
jgi:hypothetical protein